MSEIATVVLADDHPLFREGVARTLAAVPDLAVVGQASTGTEALALVEAHLPDLVLLDVSMPEGGIGAVKVIAERFPRVKVVMLTVSEDEDVVRLALRAGARGYVLKGVSGPDLVSILRSVHAGQPYVTPTLAASVLQAVGEGATPTDPLELLTSREREILHQLALGASNKQIAVTLSIGERTVKHHMTNILQKLQVRNRVEAALVAQRTFAAEPPGPETSLTGNAR